MPSESFSVSKLAEHAYLLSPKGNVTPIAEKPIALTLMAIVHGNEICGVRVLNGFLRQLIDFPWQLSVSVAFVLGNPKAALLGKRFVDYDLNRSFDAKNQSFWETRRAKELSDKVLDRTAFLLDIHQTAEPAESPFFIFPYRPASLEFARHCAVGLPIITHWGGAFSKEGLCTDEYTNQKGGTGITIELGQNGFNHFKESVGMRACLGALIYSQNIAKEKPNLVPFVEPEVYTWGEVLPWPKHDAALDEGWYNFREVEKGQRLGEVGGELLIANSSGYMMFPKYPLADQPKPSEICRILRRVALEDLGKV